MIARGAMLSAGNLLVAVPVLALVVGCAGSASLSSPEYAAPLFANKNLSIEQGASLLVPGTSTRADVLATLGPATVIKFDSGYEVWAYRSRAGRVRDEKRDANAELIVLFTPSGVVEKSRIRPAAAKLAQ
jgi:hypothetical protein